MRRIAATSTCLLAVIGLVLSLPACTGARAANSSPTTSTTLVSPISTPSPASMPPSLVDKLLVIVAENKNAAQVVADMPFLSSQSRSYGTATNYYAVSHPSLPNYLMLAGGSTFGITDDDDPAVHRLKGQSVFGQLLAAGRTAKTYAEDMPNNCALRNGGDYAVRHNPWTYFIDPVERTACEKFDIPSGSPNSGALADDIARGQLPNFGLLIPNDCNNGHSCSIATTDEWLRQWLPVVKNGADFRSGRLAVVITWDEDENDTDNRVQLVVLQTALKGRVVRMRLGHEALSATISRLGGAPPLRDARQASDVLSAFGLR
jgi:phosphatidylinositol-3-phosphatase